MSIVFTIKGRTSTLSIDFVNPIELKPGFQYGLGLIGFYTYNTIPNVEENTYFFYVENNRINKQISIPSGTYEIGDIENYIKQHLSSNNDVDNDDNNNNNNNDDDDDDDDDDQPSFFLRANNNTLKSEIFHSTHSIDFTKENSLGPLLGFSNNRILEPGVIHESDTPVNIIKVRTIRIDANITEGAYLNERPSHTLYEFSVMSEPGFSIDIVPASPIFHPVSARSIHNITLNILDQDSNPVNFRGEEIIIRLELKKWY